MPIFEATAEKPVQIIAPVSAKSREKAAIATGTNRQYVSDAKKIQSESPATLEQVRTGRINIPEAKSIILSYLWASPSIGVFPFGTSMRIPILATLISLSIALPALADPPIVESGTWKNWQAGTPYAQIVTEKDAFFGNRQVVFDHEYNSDFWASTRIGLITRWSAGSVGAYFYKHYSSTNTIHDLLQPDTMLIKVGDKILTLSGQQGFFKLSPDDAAFLASVAPNQPLVRVTMGGERFDTPIGMATVNLWKVLYAVLEPAPIVPISVPK